MGLAGCDREGGNDKVADKVVKAEGVMCSNGNMIGRIDDGVSSYKGVPFAKPPVDELRWKAPEAPDESDEDVDASEFGDTALQTEWFSEGASSLEKSEDCLTLNIWTTSPNTDEKKPVMVFFHGGAYGWGGSGDPLYDGHNFVKEHDDVIMVSANYRLGILGFIDFANVEGGENFPDAANLGILDHIQALEWVNQNIEYFGGDPNNVTIFGESAGASSTSLLMIMDETKDLFQRSISESGACVITESKEDSVAKLDLILEIAGAENMDDLMAMSTEDLVKLNETVIDDEGTTVNDMYWMPERDGKLFPEDIIEFYEKFSQSPAKDRDYMAGTNENEWNYWIAEMAMGDDDENFEVFTAWMDERMENDKNMMTEEEQKYIDDFMALQEDKDHPFDITEFYNDIVFRTPAIVQSANHSDGGGNTYMYYWKYPSDIDKFGACHAVELSYIFNNLKQTDFTGTPANPKVAKKAQEAWVNFAKTGNPSIEGVEWPKYDTKNRSTMTINEEWVVENDPLSEQRKLTEKLMKYAIK